MVADGRGLTEQPGERGEVGGEWLVQGAGEGEVGLPPSGIRWEEKEGDDGRGKPTGIEGSKELEREERGEDMDVAAKSNAVVRTPALLRGERRGDRTAWRTGEADVERGEIGEMLREEVGEKERETQGVVDCEDA